MEAVQKWGPVMSGPKKNQARLFRRIFTPHSKKSTPTSQFALQFEIWHTPFLAVKVHIGRGVKKNSGWRGPKMGSAAGYVTDTITRIRRQCLAQIIIKNPKNIMQFQAKFDEKREFAVKQNELEKMKGNEKKYIFKNTMPPIQKYKSIYITTWSTLKSMIIY